MVVVSQLYAVCLYGAYGVLDIYAKQKHPKCKESARPTRSSPTYVRPKALILAEAKRSPITERCFNEIQ